MQSFVKIKSSQNAEITLSFTDIHVGKSCPSLNFLASQICILTLFNLQYHSQQFSVYIFFKSL